MEKISRILGNSARVQSTDMKSTSPVRPGVPSFGRPVGNSPGADRDALSTAQKVGLIRDDLQEAKNSRNETKMAQEMSAQFFGRPEKMGPEELIKPGATAKISIQEEREPLVPAMSGRVEALTEGEEIETRPMSRFTPRGSFVDVRA